MHTFYDERTDTSWLIMGAGGSLDLPSPTLPILMLAFHGFRVDAGETIVQGFIGLLSERPFQWDRGEQWGHGPINFDKTQANTLFGYCTAPGGGVYVATLALIYPKGMKTIQALDLIEQYEGGGIPPMLFATLLAEDQSLRQYEAGNIPAYLVNHPPLPLGEILLSVPAYTPQATPLPARRTEAEIQAVLNRLPDEIFSSELEVSAGPGEKLTGHDYLLRLIPDLQNWRSLDVANLIWQFSLYLWSDAWWTSERMRLYAKQSLDRYGWGLLISTIALASSTCRKPIFDLQGMTLAIGSQKLRTSAPSTYKPAPFGSGLSDPVYETLMMCWFQFVEFYSMGISQEALKGLLPDGVLTIRHLGVDYQFDLDEKFEQLRWGRDNLIERAEKEAAYVPKGVFRLEVPSELLEAIQDLELRNDMTGVVLVDHIDLSHFVLYVDEDGIWARLYGKKGPGPCVRWTPHQFPQTNMVSDTFGVILDIILAALWLDLRVGGEEAVPQAGGRKDNPAGKSNGKPPSRAPTKKSSRGVLRLPRGQGRRYLHLSGRREWSTQEERRKIQRIAHSVAGHRRRLPPGYKASERQKELAEKAGIYLPPTHTYVSPSVRGGKGKAEELPRIVSKGLSMVISFLVKDEKR